MEILLARARPGLLALGFLQILAAGEVLAVCSGSSPSWTAASASRTDVADCVSAATSGDTIAVPSGFATWGSPISLASTKDLTLVGATVVTCTGTEGSSGYSCTAGGTSTTLTCSAGCFTINLAASHRISGFQMTNSTGDELISATGNQNTSKHFRIDHNQLSTTAHSWSPIRFFGGSNAVAPQGIWDHNRIEGGIAIHTNGTDELLSDSCSSCQHQLWGVQPTLGDSSQVVYLEANHFVVAAADGMINFADGNYAARGVQRFNKTEGPSITGFEYHSVQGANRGYQRWESYNNHFVDLDGNDTCFFGIMLLRGGTGVAFNNEMSGSVSGCNNSIALDNVRSDDDVGEGAGACAGSSSWDENTSGQQGWHCRDQIGISHDITQWNHNPPAAWNQNLKPAYIWGNKRSGGTITATVQSSGRNTVHIRSNRDYYDHSTATDSPQTVGVRVGTKAGMPAGCSVGVAYWVTDEGNWNQLLPAGTSGQLYKCTAPNTWTLYYTPHPYPHPWTVGGGNGSGGGPGFLPAPGNLHIVQ